MKRIRRLRSGDRSMPTRMPRFAVKAKRRADELFDTALVGLERGVDAMGGGGPA